MGILPMCRGTRDIERYSPSREIDPGPRLAKTFELTAFSKSLFVHGLRKRFANLPPEEFRRIMLQRLEKCHNRNY